MKSDSEISLVWACGGAAVGVIFSLLTLMLPWGIGAYNGWADWHLTAYNLAAALTRIVIFTVAGAAAGDLWEHLTRRPPHDPSVPRHE